MRLLNKTFLSALKNNNDNLFRLLVFASFYLLFIMPSLEIISSSPQEFKNIWKTLGVLLYIYVFFTIITLVIFKKMGFKKQNKFVFIMMFILLYFSSNYYFFAGNYGLMDYFIFHNKDIFDTSTNAIFKDIFIVIILILFTIIIFTAINKKIIENILVFILLIFIVSSIRFSYIINTNKQNNTNTAKITIKDTNTSTTKDFLKKEISFSKNGQNVLIIFFDRFMGGFVPDILKDNPKLKQDLDGFVWYPNTLSFGTGTAVGLAPIYGGYKFTNVKAMLDAKYKWNFGHQIDGTKHMRERYEISTKFMLEKFYNKGYDVSIFDANYLSDNQLQMMSNNTFQFKNIRYNKKYLETFYYPYELNKKNNNKTPFSMIKEYMIPFSIFKIISPILRKYIYSDGTWYANLSSVSINYSGVIREIAYVKSWKYISKIKETSKGSFNFITSNITHDAPVNRNMNNTFQGVIPKYSQQDEKRFKSKNMASHYYLAKEALTRASVWFKWLKDKNIYDNTKIIIVSDHGVPSAFNPMFKTQKTNNGIYYGGYHPILMVKDFNQKYNLKIDNSFMTHADTVWMSLLAIDKQAYIKYGYDKSKGFRLYTHYKDKGSLIVYDNIFEAKNWVYKSNSSNKKNYTINYKY
jgi:hypothetical protein